MYVRGLHTSLPVHCRHSGWGGLKVVFSLTDSKITRKTIDVSLQRYKGGLREELTTVDPEQIRLTECAFASVVTDGTLKFELPRLQAEPTNRRGDHTAESSKRKSVTDTTAILVSETDEAVQFGRDLFETLWAESDPVGPYLECEFPDVFG